VHQSIDLEEVFENAANAMSENIDSAQYIAIYMVEGEEAVMKAHRGHPDWFIERVKRIPYPKGLTWKTILEGKSRYVSDVAVDTDIGPSGREVGIQSYLSVPIEFEGKTVGCLAITSCEKDAYDEDELKLLDKVARQIDVAINNAKQAEALQQSGEHIREQAALLDKAKDAIVVLDLEHRIIFTNESALRLYGWTGEDIVGKKFEEEISFLLREPLEVVTEKGEWSGELPQVTRDGREIQVESRWTLVRDEEGKPKSILVINTDITEKKKLEAQFLRAQRMENLGVLAGGIAHDFNNLLQPIMLSLQILRSRFTDEKSQKMIEMLQSSADRGAGLVKQILSFARGEQARNDTLQVGYIVSEVEKVLKETFPRSIEIRTDVPKDLWTVSGDPSQLQQVVMNLCVNARDAMPEGGKLTVSGKNIVIDKCMARFNIAAEPGPYTLITVSDTGVGIPPEIIDRIFDPFFSTKELGENTGLGLSTAFTIVKNHGGFINVYSELAQGTIFKVYLPANEAAETVEEAMEEGLDEPEKGRGELILVVDDEAIIREITKAALEANGYRVITAKNGSEALGTYTDKKDEIEAVILDLIMPVMGGVAAFQALRKLNPEVKVIVATGFGDRSKLGGIDDKEVGAFLWKPFTAETLLGTLSDVLGRGPQPH